VKNYGGMEMWLHTFLTSALEIKVAMYCTSTNISYDVHMLKELSLFLPIPTFIFRVTHTLTHMCVCVCMDRVAQSV